MKPKKWIFLAAFLTLFLASAQALASTTKVGNGDNGDDLEGGEPVTSGILVETRSEAVAALKALNVPAVEGLGWLLPELEHSDLILAKKDVHAFSNDGDLESSNDRSSVYARTFAEPHAPTRFFPSALSLTRSQLVALHIHEALHRALPANVREDEEQVSLLTMAIVSPMASFDRVNRTAMKVMHTEAAPVRVAAAETSTAVAPAPMPRELPAPARWRLDLTHTSATESGAGLIENGRLQHGFFNVEEVRTAFSPMGVTKIGDLPLEPQVRVVGLLINEPSGSGFYEGPIGLTGLVRMHLSQQVSVAPYFQVNFKSLDANNPYLVAVREVHTLGGELDVHAADRYFSVNVSYTFPGSAHLGQFVPWWEKDHPNMVNFGSIFSTTMRTGKRFGRLSFGGIAELHESRGYTHTGSGNNPVENPFGNGDAFSLIRLGPEVSMTWGRAKFSLSGEMMLNQSDSTLTDLGDVAGHGMGGTSVSSTLGFEL